MEHRSNCGLNGVYISLGWFSNLVYHETEGLPSRRNFQWYKVHVLCIVQSIWQVSVPGRAHM
jgi:hypothetical protein